MVIDDLPPELLQAIFEIIHANGESAPRNPSLSVCSRVCKTWRRLSIPYLFRTLRVSWILASLTDVIPVLASHPDIAVCVKRLWLGRQGITVREISHDAVLSLLARLPSLETLALDSVRLVNPNAAPLPSSDTTRTGPIGMYKLKLVVLNNCPTSGDSWLPLLQILSLCDVDTLKISLVVGLQADWTPMIEPARRLRVRNLRMGMLSMPGERAPTPIIDHLRLALDPAYLRSVQVDCSGWDSVERTGVLLRDIGENVTSLSLNLAWPVHYKKPTEIVVPAARWDTLNLSSCRELEHLIFKVLVISDGPAQCVACADILRRVPPTLRALTIELPWVTAVRQIEDQDALDLPRIDQEVMETLITRFPQFERVTLNTHQCEEVEQWRELAARLMPRLSAAGLLVVQ